MEEMLLSLNGPWSNAACIGYCVMAMLIRISALLS